MEVPGLYSKNGNGLNSGTNHTTTLLPVEYVYSHKCHAHMFRTHQVASAGTLDHKNGGLGN